MGAPVVWFEIGGDDADGLQSFYSELFDWKMEAIPDLDYRLVDTGGEAGIPGGVYASPTDIGSYVTVYAGVDDIAVAVDRALELGGQLVEAPKPLPDGSLVGLIDDPEGHRVGLIQQAT